MIGGRGVAKIELYTNALVKVDGFTFTQMNERQIRVGFPDLFDCPDKVLDNWDEKIFWAGVKIRAEINISFDDWDATVSDTLAVTCQTFLKNMHNHTELIKLTPHIDKAAQFYWVKRVNPWWYDYPYNRWVGVAGMLEFKGIEKKSSIDIVE